MRRETVAIGLVGALLCACTSGTAAPAPTDTSASAMRSAPVVRTSSMPVSSVPTGPLTTGPNVQPGEKPPVLDSSGRQRNANGAIAFAAYYYKAIDWSLATNNALLMKQVVLPSCHGCEGYINRIDGLRSVGEVLRGGQISIRSIGLDQGSHTISANFVVMITADQNSYTVTERSGKINRFSPVVNDDALIFLRWQGSGWKVAEVTNT